MRSFAYVVAVLMGLTLGCARRQVAVKSVAAPAPPVAAPVPVAPKKVKLAILPVEKILLPKVAEALNERLGRARVAGVTDTAMTTISMDVARLQLDCAQPTNQCFEQIAKHFEADRLLWAEIERVGRPKKKAPTTIRIVLFDAERATANRTEQTFPGPVSNDELDKLVNRATTEGGAAPPAGPQ